MKLLSSIIVLMFLVVGCTTPKTSENKSKVNFRNLIDGQEVKKDLEVIFKVENMKVKPAGMIQPGTGHHHLIIDGSFIPKGRVVPSNKTHIHFGKGQTSTKVKLKPGKHTLTLQFADGQHKSYGKEYSKTITVIAK